MKFICLGSGSSGNCYYINADGYGIIIDMGIGLRGLKKHFRDYGLNMGQINSILVTHDHTDHVKSVGALSQDFHVPVYTSQEVHNGMDRNCLMTKKIKAEEKKVITHHVPFQLGPFVVTSFPVPHDSSGNNGYLIEYGQVAFCLITDAGEITADMVPYVARANNLVIEANYDAAMLQNGPYPNFLKRRIASNTGHLCNETTAEGLANHLSPNANRVWLCHLSEENNHPELARKTVETALITKGFAVGEQLQLEILKRKVPTGIYNL